MSAPRITFAIPAYNQSERYLRTAIQSVLDQTFAGWTAVVVDDWPGPSEYARIVDSYGDSRVRYLRNVSEHGIGAAWNAGLLAADTEFVTLLHADDALEPSYASAMLALAERHPDGMFYACEPILIDEHDRAPSTLRNRFRNAIMRAVRPPGHEYTVDGWPGIARLSLANFIICPSVLYRRSAISGRRFSTRLRFVLDLDFAIETLLAGGRIYGTTERHIRYRRHAAQATATLSRDTAAFDEVIAYNAELRGRLRGTPFARAIPFVGIAPFARMDEVVRATAELTAGRFVSAARRTLRAIALTNPKRGA